MESRLSRDSGARTPSIHENPDVFSDDYAVEVADGFRPGQHHEQVEEGGRTSAEQASALARRSLSIGNPTDIRTATNISLSRNSTQKGYGALDPNRLSRDAARGFPLPTRAESLRSSGSSGTGAQHRSDSSASSSTLMGNVRSQSPFQATGPSHPYALYPQGVAVGRSPSVTTASTLRVPQRSESSATRPAHPYRMYEQNVFADPQDHNVSPIDESIPVGFPGHSTNQQFLRRIGPEGEEQDIIGPDGHAEQLPPYSKYPEDGTGNKLLADTCPSNAEAHLVNSNDALVPSSTTRDESAREAAVISNAQTSRSPEEMESGSAEKSWSQKSWKQKRQTRVCRGKMPCWILVLVVAIIVVLVAIIGGIVGGFVAHDQAAKESTESYISSLQNPPPLSDATPVPTPAGLPVLPSGTYGLPLGFPRSLDQSCITDPDQQSAWTCQIPGAPKSAPVNLVVNPPDGHGGPATAAVVNPEGPIKQYGSQPPQFGPLGLELVRDLNSNDDKAYGLAYYFQSTYDKLVVVDEDAFNSSGGAWKRDGGFSMPPSWGHRNQIEPGSKPWFCWWNQTSVELFIYDQRNVSATASSSLSSMITATSIQASPMPSSSATPGPTTDTYPPTSMPDTTSIPLSSTTISLAPSSTSSPSSSASDGDTYPTPSSDWLNDGSSNPSDVSWPGNNAAVSSAGSQDYGGGYGNGNSYSDNGGDDDSGNYRAVRRNWGGPSDSNANVYPRPVKIDERREPNGVAPYCIQMQLLDDGSYGQAANSDGGNEPNIIQLQESSDPKVKERRDMLERRGGGSGCQCEWVSS
ncbi:MAG: hypothetical protein M1820_010338 [Bogoriella megaspora]|nr:MAG: hypothetical protein M1820_010338 [Bogoriella megaspora]